MNAGARILHRLLATVLLLVLTACGGDGGTNALNPTPGITALAPASIQQGAEETIILILGSDFIRTSVARLNGATRPTEYVSRAEVRVRLTAADLANSGMAQIVVVNPEPGGGASNPAQLTITVRVNPVPSVSTLVPGFVLAGSAATTMTVHGTGFVSQSQVAVGNGARPTTFVSPTELRVQISDTMLATGATLPVRVTNPFPGGGVSAVMNFEVRAPQPVLSALGTTRTTAGQQSFTLRVHGTGFVTGSAVNLAGAPVPTTFVSASVLDAVLAEGHLRAAGVYPVTVVNAGPGGGTSGGLPLEIVHAIPEITLLPSQGASAGRPGFTLYLHGRGFANGSVVRWNGADRPTQYLSGTRLAAVIGAEDVSAPGAVQITVHSPAPGGGTSPGVPFNIRALGPAAVTSEQAFPLAGRDVVYDPTTSRLYVTIAGSAAAHANSVAEVNPTTGAIVRSAFVGSEPVRIVRSDDGRFLYVGLNGASAVRRVDLPTLTPALQWSLPAGHVAGDLEVAPGQPRTVAVSRQRPGYSPPLEGVTIYDDGVARPQSSPGHTGGNRIEFLESSTVLYGYNNAHTGFEFFTMAVDGAGVRHAQTSGGLISGFYTDILGESGRIYGTNGSVVDAERRVVLGTLGSGAAIAVDARLGRAFLLDEEGVRVYDLNTFQLLGSLPVAEIWLDHPALVVSRLVRWGDDGLAFLTPNRLFLIRSPLIGP